MTFKNIIANWVFCTFLCLSIASCNSDSTTYYEYETPSYTNALVKSFSFAETDSIDYGSDRDTIKFAIDHFGVTDAKFNQEYPGYGIIFNADSLPFGTEDKAFPVNMAFSYPSSVIFRHYDAFGAEADTTDFGIRDTIHFLAYDKTVLEIVAGDYTTKKRYLVKVNVHKVEGDTIEWHARNIAAVDNGQVVQAQTTDTLAGNLYWFIERGGVQDVYRMKPQGSQLMVDAELGTLSGATLDLPTMSNFSDALYAVSTDGALVCSTDAKAWSVVNSSYKFVNILGATLATSKSAAQLFAIVDQSGTFYFASSADGETWTLGEALPANFPISGYSNPITMASKPSLGTVSSRLSIVGGRTAGGQLTASTWSTDGKSWAEFTPTNIPVMEGASVIKYTVSPTNPETFWILYPGQTASGASKQIYFSENNGVSWRVLKSEYKAYADNSALAASAFHTPYFDRSQWRMFFIGGMVGDSQQLQVIDGQLTKLLFDVIQ